MKTAFARYSLLLLTLSLAGASATSAQTPPDELNHPAPASSTPAALPSPSPKRNLLINVLRDQRAIWLAPFNLNKGDGKWLAPIGLTTMALIATDRHTSGELVEHGEKLGLTRTSKAISHAGSFYAAGTVAAAFYLAGRAKNNPKARETGVLAAEALIDGFLVVEALKLISERQRPPVDHQSGEFFDGGRSFPSGHATSAWSVATIIAHEYGRHRPAVQIGAYGLATAVSLSRFTGRNHFLSDVLVGSALGYGIGRYVYRTRHDASLDSTDGRTTSCLFRDFPRIVPLYEPSARAYGVSATWSF